MIRRHSSAPKAQTTPHRGRRLKSQQRATAAAAARVLADAVPLTVAIEALRVAGFAVSEHPKPATTLPLITPGQRRVLAGILNGKSAAAIAADLALSVHTVNNHTRQIFLTLGVHSRARVILCCLASGVTAETLGLEG